MEKYYPNPETVIHGLVVLSILFAAGFGLLALFTEYKDDDGRVTRYGRIASAGVILSALLSIITNVLQQQVKARADAAAALTRSDDEKRRQEAMREQLAANAALRVITGSTNRLQRRMEESAQKLRASLARADELSLSLGKLQKVEGARFISSMESVWDTRTVVQPRSLSVAVTYLCTGDQSLVDEMLSKPSTLALFVVGKDHLKGYLQATGFKSDGSPPSAPHEDVLAGPRLISRRHSIDRSGLADRDDSIVTTFSGFTAPGGMSFYTMLSNWLVASVHFDESSDIPIDVEAISRAFGPDALTDTNLVWQRDGTRAYELPCVTMAEFRIEDSDVASGHTKLIFERVGSGSRGVLKTIGGLLRIQPSTIPTMIVVAR